MKKRTADEAEKRTDREADIKARAKACEQIMETDTIGGLVHTVPAHATVIILLFPLSSQQLTITTGNGYSIFPALNVTFSIIILSVYQI